MDLPSPGPSPLPKPATLRDVAQLAGVSVATVSKTLSGGYRLRAETQDRVRAAAQSLNFAPNQLAASLHRRTSGTIGLLMSGLDGRFSIPVMMGAEDAFESGEVSVFLCDTRADPARELRHIQALLARRVDGLIFVGESTTPRESIGHTLPVPVVYAYSPSADDGDISVVSDNFDAGRMAARELLDGGRRRIAYIGGEADYVGSRNRAAGAVSALADHGTALIAGGALFGDWSEAWGRTAVRRILADHPDIDGLLCGSDQLARGVLDELREQGISVPGDVAVMGHDNLTSIAMQSRPSLSTIDMELGEIGRVAARLLFAAIEGDFDTGRHQIAARVVVRQSSGPALHAH